MTANVYRFFIFAIFFVAVNTSLRRSKRALWLGTGFFCNSSDHSVISHFEIATSKFDKEAGICLRGDSLNLSSMNMSAIPPLPYFTPCFPARENIMLLHINSNSICSLPENFFQHLSYLKSISLNANHITKISSGIFTDHETLEFVDLGRNKISAITGGAFSNMSSLQILILTRNRLKEFSSGWFPNTGNLTRLIFSYNRIETLPEGVFQNILDIHDAREISFNNNKIRYLSSKTFQGVKKIGVLALQYNKIRRWKDDFFDGQYIKTLKMYNNNITCPEGDLDRIFKAWKIDLCGNPLTEDCIDDIRMWKMLRCATRQHIPIVTECLFRKVYPRWR